MIFCGDCLYYVALVEGEVGYSDAEPRGRCIFCPPRPTGEYKEDLALWPIVSPTHFICGKCMCRGCGQ